ncbi:hypothetical protein [uncultured Enorma sp.]|uniref:hypothetical protein n=1 Tax=uncultured Enorma sp. TaxID=1714346 RepID=UPI002599CDB9|nr:hypothetical protein [uncultured Enorma sp.]
MDERDTSIDRVVPQYMDRIAEQGVGACVFCSEEAFERRAASEREETTFEARLSETIGRGVADIEAGRFTTSVGDAFQRADELRNKRT